MITGKSRGFWVIDCSEDNSSILYRSKGLTHQKTVGWHWSSLSMQLTCYLSIVLIMVSEFITYISCGLSYLTYCMRFEVREHTNTKQRHCWLGYFDVLFSPHVYIHWPFWYAQWCQGWGSCRGLAARAMPAQCNAVLCCVTLCAPHCACRHMGKVQQCLMGQQYFGIGFLDWYWQLAPLDKYLDWFPSYKTLLLLCGNLHPLLILLKSLPKPYWLMHLGLWQLLSATI